MYESAVQWQQRILRVTLFRQSEKNQDQNDDIARILWAFKISKIEQSATFSFGVAIFGAREKQFHKFGQTIFIAKILNRMNSVQTFNSNKSKYPFNWVGFKSQL